MALPALSPAIKKRTRRTGCVLGKTFRGGRRLGAGVFFDVFHDVSDALEFFGFFIGHFDGEFFFKGHDELDGVEGVGPEVFDEAGCEDDLLGIHAELIDDDVTDFFFDGFF